MTDDDQIEKFEARLISAARVMILVVCLSTMTAPAAIAMEWLR
jgi:hypothetical protein